MTDEKDDPKNELRNEWLLHPYAREVYLPAMKAALVMKLQLLVQVAAKTTDPQVAAAYASFQAVRELNMNLGNVKMEMTNE
jgi:hypothetical protein